MTSSGWREVLVDVDPSDEGRSLRFVLSPSPTPASAAYTSSSGAGEGEWLEVCPQALVCAQELGERVVSDGGAALIADYGRKQKKNTLRVSVSPL